METDTLIFDVHALVSHSNQHIVFGSDGPSYRIYIDDYLMTERTYNVDNFHGVYVQEHCPIKLLRDNIMLRFEWIDSPINFDINNVHLHHKAISHIQSNKTNNSYTATINYEN